MGNCIDVFNCKEQKVNVIFKGEENKFSASTMAKNVISGAYKGYKLVHCSQPYSPLPLIAKLEAGEVYYLVQPCRTRVMLKLVDSKNGRSRIVKTLVTKQQLKLLLQSAKKFQPGEAHITIKGSFVVRGKFQKWQPNLAAIPEEHCF